MTSLVVTIAEDRRRRPNIRTPSTGRDLGAQRPASRALQRVMAQRITILIIAGVAPCSRGPNRIRSRSTLLITYSVTHWT